MKLPLYARAGIPEVWIVDLGRRVVDAYRHIGRKRYAERTAHRPDARVALASAPEIVVALNLLFG